MSQMCEGVFLPNPALSSGQDSLAFMPVPFVEKRHWLAVRILLNPQAPAGLIDLDSQLLEVIPGF